MNLQQLEYIIAVDQYRHFANAAEACFVTQPTLSMMIRKLEDELDVRIFDRSRQPVVPTETGQLIIDQARRILRETAMLTEIVERRKAEPEGTLQIGIIPTLAPYLVPLFIRSFLVNYPKVQLKIAEHTTDVLLDLLKRGQLDVGILVTPLNQSNFREIPMFYEALVVYSSHDDHKQFILPEEIDPNELWLLEEGHCFRSQILNLCELRKKPLDNLDYSAGSIETLIRLVETQNGITVLPELATKGMSSSRKRRLIPFAQPVPVREVSLVTDRDHVKKHLIDLLQREILSNLPKEILDKAEFHRIGIEVV